MNGDLSIGSINGGGVSSYNLIINPEFTINQRGAASRTATSSAYNYDRWYYDGTYLYQGIENASLRNGTYCLSWSGASTAAHSLNSSSSSSQGGESYTAVTNGGTFTISGLGSETLWVRFASDLTNLSQVCLRKGTSPLTFEHRNYGEELALCQRYYEKSFPVETVPSYTNFTGSVDGNNGNNVCDDYSRFGYPFKVIKRAAPTMIFFSAANSGQIRYLKSTGSVVNGIHGNTSANDSFFNIHGSFTGSGSSSYIRSISFEFTASAEL